MHILYPPQYKSEVAEFVKCLGQRETARLFDISQRRVFDWFSQHQKWDETRSYHHAKNETEVPKRSLSKHQRPISESAPKISEQPVSLPVKLSKKSTTQLIDMNIEKTVSDWVKSQLPMKVSSTKIRDKARELYRNKGYTKVQCSYGWYRRWAKRFDHSSSHHEDSDPELICWILKQFDNNYNVTHSELQTYARNLMGVRNPDFQASAGWSSRFFKRHHVLLNCFVHYDLPLPYPLEAHVQEYLTKVVAGWRQRHEGQGSIGSIGCMDEIPLSFSSSSEGNEHSTPNSEFMKHSSHLRKTTIKNCEATVILSSLLTGQLLPPMIIVKSQSPSNTNQVYTKCENPVTVFYAETCEPNTKSLEKWIELIWMKNIEPNKPSVLLCDAYEIHYGIRGKCEENHICLELFPSGTACKLQPLNVFSRHAFLQGVRDEWTKYIKTHNSEDTKMDLPSNNDIVDWVYSTFLDLKEKKEEIKASFVKTGLNPYDWQNRPYSTKSDL